MTIGKKVKEALKGGTVKAKPRLFLSCGDAIRIAREMNGFTQQRLAELAGLAQATISSLEKNRINLGVERAKVLARVLRVHPSVLLFPQWDMQDAA